jgi:hypothetical protein
VNIQHPRGKDKEDLIVYQFEIRYWISALLIEPKLIEWRSKPN